MVRVAEDDGADVRKAAKPRKTADDRLRERLERSEAARTAQQAELDDLRVAVATLAAPKPGRAFRTRKLIHGPLDITIKGTDVTEAEVVIEHVGGYLAVKVGDAIGSRLGSATPREAYRYTPAPDPQNPVAPTAEHTAIPDESSRKFAAAIYNAAVDAHPGIDKPVYTDDGKLVTNADLGPQANPRAAGGYQIRTEAAVIAAQDYGGWNGIGERPAGWRDPDVAPSEEPSN